MESRKPPDKNYYDVLGVAPDATVTSIKKAYRALAQRFHPDRMQAQEESTTAAERMIAINEAFAVLSDKKRRAAHDRERAAGSKPAAVAEPEPLDWEMAAPRPAAAQAPHPNPTLDQTVAQDFLQKLKTVLVREGTAANLREEQEKSWLWGFLGKTWGGNYWVSLRVCPVLNPNIAREVITHVQAVVTKRRSGWKSNYFVFVLGFQTLSEGDSVLKILRAFCNREENSARRNLVNIVVMDLGHRRSVLCGKRTHEAGLDPILRAVGVA